MRHEDSWNPADARDDEETGPASLADIFFYVTFIVAMVVVISREGWNPAGL